MSEPDVAGQDLVRDIPRTEPAPGKRDETMPEGRWAFDPEVTESFDDMLERSIPQLDVMRSAVTGLAQRRLRKPFSLVDLGTSRGGAVADVLEAVGPRWPGRALAVEISPPMLEAARVRFAEEPRVEVVRIDLRGEYPDVAGVDVTLAVLCAQFVPIEHRMRLLRDVHQSLRRGGALILVEKVLGASADLDSSMVSLYYERKRAAGYSEEAIERKRLALEGVLVPVTARMNEEFLAAAGFTEVDCVWRWMNFAGWIAVRS